MSSARRSHVCFVLMPVNQLFVRPAYLVTVFRIADWYQRGRLHGFENICLIRLTSVSAPGKYDPHSGSHTRSETDTEAQPEGKVTSNSADYYTDTGPESVSKSQSESDGAV